MKNEGPVENAEPDGYDVATGEPVYDTFDEDPEEMERLYEERLAARRAERQARYRARVRKAWFYRILAAFILIDVILLLVVGVRALGGKLHFGKQGETQESVLNPGSDASDEANAGDGTVVVTSGENGGETETAAAPQDARTALFAKADRLAAMYDYDAAAETLANSDYKEDPEALSRIERYQATAATMVAADNSEITHVFFHILTVDTERAFTDDRQGKDFNQVMTTIPEFEKILQQMYERGYVLVGLHDIAEVQKQDDGTEKMVSKKIMLPEGKKPFVMSEDDVCYYEYMEGRGFADKMVLDENGKLKLQYTDAAGNASIGDYDIVPILDNFVDEHPDFSYRGAKAIMAFTGYNGVLGYRTDETYDASSPNYDPKNTANPNIEADRETVKTLMKALVEDGYELASHSWGHINFTNRSLADLTRDTDRWERNVETLMPEPCDIILYPFGADIGDWHPYSADNEKFQMLDKAGFRYFCNVDSTKAWTQISGDTMRQGRRNLDGYRLWKDYCGEDTKLSDLMDVQSVFDTRRPTPIEWN
ncbi:polysaccharide deacetylase family protein [Oribacterium sp. Sow4_G1_1]|uniref:polysaccharide deacetylase family protein n=1 Tax=Oribacterium sp. Sow4_G1_1 TaxID=3438794 RepID=UPI003F963DA4